MAQQLQVGQNVLISKASRLHSDTPQLVELLWKGDQPDAEFVPDNTQHSRQTDIHDSGEIRIRTASKRAAAYPRLRPRGHWERWLRGLRLS
jgi:hypothetical protein